MPEAHPRASQLTLWRDSVPITFRGHLQREMPLLPRDSPVARGRFHAEPYGSENANKQAS